MGELQMGGCTTSRPFSNLESDLYIFKRISRYLIKSVQLYQHLVDMILDLTRSVLQCGLK